MLLALGSSIVSLTVWLLLLGVVLVPVERMWPLRSQRLFRKQFGADVVYYFLGGITPGLLLLFPLSLLAAVLHRLVPLAYYHFISDLPFSLRMAGAMVVGEIGGYWGHRLSHEIPLLWRFHALHHSAEELDWLVNSRAHPVDLCFVRFCGLLPVYILGLAQPSADTVDWAPALITIFGKAWTFFIHANLRWRLGPIEWLVSSPAFHHWHHTNDDPALINKNYAAILPWVDRIFGTFYLPGKWPDRYGINERVGKNVGEQLIDPFAGSLRGS